MLPNEKRVSILKKIMKGRLMREDYESVRVVDTLLRELIMINLGKSFPSEAELELINIAYNEIILKELNDGNID